MEVVFAGMVLTISVLGVAASVATSGGMGDRSRDEMRARRVVQSWIHDIQARPFMTVGFTMHRVAFDVPGLDPAPDAADGRVGSIVFSDGPLPNTYFVDVRASWENRAGTREVHSRIVLAEIKSEFGDRPSIARLDAAAATRAVAPAELQEVRRLGEELLSDDPVAPWAEPLAIAMDHVREAELLLGTTPVDLSRIVSELEAGLVQVQRATESGVDSSIGRTMAEKLSCLISGLEGG
ncbi:MAG: type IV pilus modification PilV family protein [Planctomycetota bacterium]